MPLWVRTGLMPILRYGIAIIATWLKASGVWDEETANTVVDGAVADLLSYILILGPVVWGVVVKNIDKLNFIKAASSSQFMTESEVKAAPAPSEKTIAAVTESKPTDKTLGVLLVLGLTAASVVACGKVNPVLVTAENAVYVAATKVDDEFRKVCTEQQLTAPCDDARPFVLELVTAAKTFNRSVAAQNLAGLTDVLSASGRLTKKVEALPSGKTVQLVHSIADAVTAAAKGWK